MKIYIGLLLSTFVSLNLYGKNLKKIYSVIPFVMMAIVSGFRYYVGVDYKNYVKYFDGAEYIKAEIGYRVLTDTVRAIGGTQQLVFLIMASLTAYFTYKFIMSESANSSDYRIAVVMYLCLGPFYFSSFNTIREALAISICLYALTFLEKKPLVFCAYILFASMFHTSALIIILLLFFGKSRISGLSIAVYGTTILYLLMRFEVIDYVVLKIAPRYWKYLTYYSKTMDLSYLLFGIIAFVFLILIKIHAIDLAKKYELMFSADFVFIFLALSTGKMTMMFTRLISYVSPILIVGVPRVSLLFNQKIFYKFCVLGLCVLYYFFIIKTGRALLPYSMNFKLFA